MVQFSGAGATCFTFCWLSTCRHVTLLFFSGTLADNTPPLLNLILMRGDRFFRRVDVIGTRDHQNAGSAGLRGLLPVLHCNDHQKGPGPLFVLSLLIYLVFLSMHLLYTSVSIVSLLFHLSPVFPAGPPNMAVSALEFVRGSDTCLLPPRLGKLGQVSPTLFVLPQVPQGAPQLSFPFSPFPLVHKPTV